mgnify:CR=1 FL=1
MAFRFPRLPYTYSLPHVFNGLQVLGMFFSKTAKGGNRTPSTNIYGGGWVTLVDSEGTFPIIKLYMGRVRVLALNHVSELVGNLTLCLYDSKEKVVLQVPRKPSDSLMVATSGT